MAQQYFFRFLIGVLMATAAWLGYSLYANDADGYPKIQHLETGLANIKAEVTKLQLDNKTLNRQLADSRDNPAYIEKQARELLFMIKPGEILVQPVKE